METKEMEGLYSKIANKVNEIIPVKWDKVILFAEVSEDASEVFFYFYPIGVHEPVYNLDIPRLYAIDEELVDVLRYELNDYFEDLWGAFKRSNQDTWTNLTLTLDKTGKFKIDYSYEDLSGTDAYERQIIWEYKHLGICPEEGRSKKIIEQYIERQKAN